MISSGSQSPIITENTSSPPNRVERLFSGVALKRAWATAAMELSPSACPKLSLIYFNPSRSDMITVMGLFLFSGFFLSLLKIFIKPIRLYSPVRGSCRYISSIFSRSMLWYCILIKPPMPILMALVTPIALE